MHGFSLSWQNRRQNPPLRCRSHSFWDLYPYSLPVFPGKRQFLPGRFSLVQITAFLAASLARCASTDLSTMVFRHRRILLQKNLQMFCLPQHPRHLSPHCYPASVFVCPSNCGSSIFTLMMAVRPSRISSPASFSFSFNSLFFLAYSLKVFVSALRNPTT